MSDTSSFAAVERQLTAYLRNPQAAPPPDDVDPARVAVYARLVRHNVDSLLANCFPVLHSVCEAAHWQDLVGDFLARHRAQTPLFPHLPQEFVNFLATARAGDAPWLAELADYEWLEMECNQDPRDIDDVARVDEDADLLDDFPVLNPLARPRRYTYAVHTIAPARIPASAAPEPVWLVVYRDRTDKVSFVELNAVSARLVELMARNEDAADNGRALLGRIAEELAHPRPAQLLDAGRRVLEDLRTRGLVLGARRRAGAD